MIIVREVTTRADWHTFHTFPINLYADTPQYIPSLIQDEKRSFNPKKNPAYDYVETICFLAFADGRPVGRISGLINHRMNELKHERTVRFHRYDVIDDFEVSKKLFDAITCWAREHGMNRMIGPIGFSNLDKQGLLVEGFEETGMLITLYNHPYYEEHLQKLGFSKDVDWVEYRIAVPEKIDDRIERICNLAMKRNGYHLLEFKTKRAVVPYAKQMFHMYNESFAALYGFIALSDKQIDRAVKQFIGLISLDYIFIVVDAEDQVLGFGIMAPSLSTALKKSKGRLFPLGWYRILRSMRHHTVLDMYLIAVKPAYQGRGVNAVIINEGVKKAMEHGVHFAETGPELEENVNVQSQWKSFQVRQHKRRRCFVKTLEESI